LLILVITIVSTYLKILELSIIKIITTQYY